MRTANTIELLPESEVLLAIRTMMETNEAIHKVLKKLNIDVIRFYETVYNSEQLNQKFISAQQAKCERLADEVLDIADDPDIDAARARNRINARQWIVAKHHPQKYGERLNIEVTKSIDISQALIDARKRSGINDALRDETSDLSLRDPQKLIEVQSRDITSDSNETKPGHTPVNDQGQNAPSGEEKPSIDLVDDIFS